MTCSAASSRPASRKPRSPGSWASPGRPCRRCWRAEERPRASPAEFRREPGTDLHHIGVFYQIRITGGELRFETGGSTEKAAWLPLEQIGDLPRAAVVDVGIALAREQPPSGHVDQVPLGGLIRY
ncbi:MAG TPA: hypothetical protein VGI64_18265 [Streptosporangiaceae bacterium]